VEELGENGTIPIDRDTAAIPAGGRTCLSNIMCIIPYFIK